ncbi:large ribosomal subunit protein P1-like [Cannabis sativa]|uniref:large ribosomal subunit protein P1-like n=1 Tax=Cannabis sativa TaxID=3483 RepID=UPI0029CA6D5B|nr:large ribosomal subunit protein P1-like [Cannabis sativa]
MSIEEQACSYAIMALHDDGIPITAEKIATLVKAANVKVESYWFGLFAKLAEKRNIDDLIMSVGVGGGTGVPVTTNNVDSTSNVVAPALAKDNKKEEEIKEESDDEICFSLFDD